MSESRRDGRSNERLADAGLPPLPRMAWLEIDLEALSGNLAVLRELAGPGVPVRPVVKADAYGHGARPGRPGARGRRCRRPVRGHHRRGARAARRWRARADPGPVPDPGRAGSARRPAWASRSRGGDRTGAGRDGPSLPPARTRPAAGHPPRGRDRARPRRAVAAADLVAAARLVQDAPGLVLAGLWTHFQAVEDAGHHGGPARRLRGGRRRTSPRPGIDLPPRHVAASAALLTDGVVALRRCPARPGDLRPRAGRARAVRRSRHGRPARLRPVLSLHARPVRVADLPAGHGISYGPTFRTARPSRIATLPLGYGDGWSRALSNRAERHRPGPAGAARRERGDGRGHGGRHRRPRAAGRHERRVHAHRPVRATCGSVWRRWRRCAPRTRGRSSPGCPADCLGCTMPRRGRSVCERSPSGEGRAWLRSSSGTATSANSRSTPS